MSRLNRDPEKAVFTWSGGKDSAFALYNVLKQGDYRVISLLTTVTKDYDRISMHGVRKTLLNKQAQSIGLPIDIVYIGKGSSNEDYETMMRGTLKKYLAMGIRTVAFGDIFLEDIRKYREENLNKIGMKAHFPIWKQNTKILADNFINLGFKAIITCIDTHYLGKEYAGREYDKAFLNDLPETVDPCGENGEFHTFVYDGPIFTKSIIFKKGKVVLRENRFYFCDIYK